MHLVRSSEAVITVGGRMGSLHEFTTAVESHKICAVLLGSGGLADFIPTLVERIPGIPSPGKDAIIYDTNPERLVVRVIEALDKKYMDFDDPSNERKKEAKSPDTNRQG